jgi:hypothetical protein
MTDAIDELVREDYTFDALGRFMIFIDEAESIENIEPHLTVLGATCKRGHCNDLRGTRRVLICLHELMRRADSIPLHAWIVSSIVLDEFVTLMATEKSATADGLQICLMHALFTCKHSKTNYLITPNFLDHLLRVAIRFPRHWLLQTMVVDYLDLLAPHLDADHMHRALDYLGAEMAVSRELVFACYGALGCNRHADDAEIAKIIQITASIIILGADQSLALYHAHALAMRRILELRRGFDDLVSLARVCHSIMGYATPDIKTCTLVCTRFFSVVRNDLKNKKACMLFMDFVAVVAPLDAIRQDLLISFGCASMLARIRNEHPDIRRITDHTFNKCGLTCDEPYGEIPPQYLRWMSKKDGSPMPMPFCCLCSFPLRPTTPGVQLDDSQFAHPRCSLVFF